MMNSNDINGKKFFWVVLLLATTVMLSRMWNGSNRANASSMTILNITRISAEEDQSIFGGYPPQGGGCEDKGACLKKPQLFNLQCELPTSDNNNADDCNTLDENANRSPTKCLDKKVPLADNWKCIALSSGQGCENASDSSCYTETLGFCTTSISTDGTLNCNCVSTPPSPAGARMVCLPNASGGGGA